MAHLMQDSDDFIPDPERNHKTVHVQHGGEAAEIDELIAPLILELWKAEIPTCQSCQDSPCGSGFFWLQFDEQGALERFLNMVALFTKEWGNIRLV